MLQIHLTYTHTHIQKKMNIFGKFFNFACIYLYIFVTIYALNVTLTYTVDSSLSPHILNLI